jgi:hypothetical protein
VVWSSRAVFCCLVEANLGLRSSEMESSDDGGSGPPAAVGMGSPGPSSAPAAVGGASSAPGASGSGGKPPVKRVMKTPYQLEVLERTYAGSSTTDDSECSGGLFLRAFD